RIPTTDIPKRLCAIMHRRPTTPWSEREYRQYTKLVKVGAFSDTTDLELVERYYIFERKRGEKGFHRRDLLTLLNNWSGEVDRATDFAERHPIKPPPRKIIPITIPSEPYIAPVRTEAEQREHDRFMA